MGRYAIEVSGKQFVIECKNKPAAMFMFNEKGYSVSVRDITELDKPPSSRPKLPPKVMVPIRPPESAIQDLIALGITDKAAQKKFFVDAGLEKIERLKKDANP